MDGTKTGRYIRRSECEWRQVLERQRASGLSVSHFCRVHAMSEANFYRWRTLLQTDTSAPSTPTDSAFIELGAVNRAAPAEHRFELTIAIARIFVLRLARH